MEPTIEQIIREIPEGMYFDSHYIIDTLIKDHSDMYLAFAASNGVGPVNTANMHSRIAKLIKSLIPAPFQLVTQPNMQSWSYTIHGTASECELWQRV